MSLSKQLYGFGSHQETESCDCRSFLECFELKDSLDSTCVLVALRIVTFKTGSLS